jgi:N-acetylglucosaminyl-diphospho-decaprenol L-rhamnosyltransferase
VLSAPVAVAVVSTNLRELLAATLRSLEPEARAGRAEVWVVDTASSDGSPEMVREEFPWVSLIASEENLGYGPAINRVVERTESEWIAPANEDIELEPGALERMLACAGEHPQAAVIAPRLVLPDGTAQHSVHAFPTVVRTALWASGIEHLSPRLAERLCAFGAWDPDRAREVPWAIATFLLVRRSAFEAVGGFEDAHWMHAEDLDLSWRLARAGWRTRYEPAAIVHHVGSAATKQAFGEELEPRWWAATYRFLAERRGLAVAWTVAALNLLGALVRMPFAGRERRGRLRTWARIHRQGLRSRRSLMAFR